MQHLMRQTLPIETNANNPQLTDETNRANTPPISSDAHNASTAPFFTDLDQNITSDKAVWTKEIPEFTAIQLARFWSRVEIGTVDECWLWTGNKALASPYSPDIYYGNYLGFKVHRLAYTLLVGPIPEGLTIDHVKDRGCANTLCCNPAHLEPVTMAEQVRRRDIDKLVAPGFSRCKYGHIRPIGRKAHCKECARMHAKLFRERHPDRAREIAKQSYERNKGKVTSDPNGIHYNNGIAQ